MGAGIGSAYEAAKDRYAEAGVDVDAALKRLAAVPISLHCWQGDDVEGFEKFGTGLGGGLTGLCVDTWKAPFQPARVVW